MSILRSSIFFLFVSTFFLFSCSKDKNEPDNAGTREKLINKKWLVNAINVKINGKDYSLTGATAEMYSTSIGTGSFTFKDNGEFISADEDGSEEKGTWNLADNKLTMTQDGEGLTFTVDSAEDKALTLGIVKNMDLTKNMNSYTDEEFIAYMLGQVSVMKDPKVDLTKGTMDVSLGLYTK